MAAPDGKQRQLRRALQLVFALLDPVGGAPRTRLRLPRHKDQWAAAARRLGLPSAGGAFRRRASGVREGGSEQILQYFFRYFYIFLLI